MKPFNTLQLLVIGLLAGLIGAVLVSFALSAFDSTARIRDERTVRFP